MTSSGKVNQCTFERFLRVLLGLALLSLVSETKWGLIGFLPLFTGAIGLCPFYSFVGLNSCKNQTSSEAIQN